MSNNYRPADHQIENNFECSSCGQSYSCYGSQEMPICCGIPMDQKGFNTPSNTDDWEEQLDPDGEWRERRW